MNLIKQYFSNFIVIINYLKSDLIKKQRTFRIGLISIYLVIFFLSILLYAISLFPNIFIRICEEQVGESDFIFLPLLLKSDMLEKKSNFEKKIFFKEEEKSDYLNLKLLDFDDVNKKLQNVSFLKGISPRWMLRGNATHKNVNKTNWAISNLIILDSDLENKMGMGRKLNLPSLFLNECYVSSSLLKSLKADLNSFNDSLISIDVKLSALLNALSNNEVNNLITNYKNQMQNQVNYYEERFKEDENDDFEEEEIKVDDDENEFNFEGGFLRNFINDKIIELNLDNIVINSEIIKNYLNTFFNIDEINIENIDNFTISGKLLRSDLLKNIPIIKEINDVVINGDPIKKYFSLVGLIFDYNKTGDFIYFTNNAKEIIKKFKNNLLNNFNFSLNLSEILNKFSDDELDNIFSFQINLTIVDKVKSDEGKWPSSSGNVVAIDSKFINNYLNVNMQRILNIIFNKMNNNNLFYQNLILSHSKNFISMFNINKYCLTINAIIQNKFELYKLSKNEMRRKISSLTEKIIKVLGVKYPIQITTPIFTVMEQLEMGKVFLDNIFLAIVFFLWMLCVLLIYSLMLGNVDERTYEFGMLRSLGFKKDNLIILIIIQGFLFAIPGIFLGLISAYCVNHFIAFLFNIYSGLLTPFFLTARIFWFGVFIGISIPLFSSYFPIKKTLNANLKETLTIFNKKIGDLIVEMVKLENLGISPSAFVVSLILIVMGFSTFYLAPLSFILMNPSLFVFIMIMILLTMLFGLIILVQIFVPDLELLILNIFFWFVRFDRNLHFIVVKNLEGHKRRNKKVSIMFMIALGSIIFSGCTLNLFIKFAQNLSKSAMGGDVMIWYLDSRKETLNEQLFENYLKETKEKFPNLISNYTFVSFPFSSLTGYATDFSSLNGFPSFPREIYAIDKNYLFSSYNELYQVSEYDKKLNFSFVNKKIDLVSMLYKNPFVQKILKKNSSINYPFDTKSINNENVKNLNNFQFNVICAEGIRNTLAVSTIHHGMLQIKANYLQKIPVKIVGMSKKFPGTLTYSSYNSLSFFSSLFTSFEQMKSFINIERKINFDLDKRLNNNNNLNVKTLDGIRKQGLYLKFNEKAPENLREMVFFEIKNLLENDNALSQILDDIIKTSEKIRKIMEIIFLILGLIALILSFFLIWTSFYSNIKENICEYGIMRSMGITIAQSTRIYLYEAASILLASIVAGTFIGIIISVSLILQFNMFIELPFEFNFPFRLYFILTGFGFFMGLLGSFYPIYEVNHMSLIKIMKGLSE